MVGGIPSRFVGGVLVLRKALLWTSLNGWAELLRRVLEGAEEQVWYGGAGALQGACPESWDCSRVERGFIGGRRTPSKGWLAAGGLQSCTLGVEGGGALECGLVGGKCTPSEGLPAAGRC